MSGLVAEAPTMRWVNATRLAEMEAEIDYLRGELGLVRSGVTEAALRRAFKLGPHPTKALQVILSLKGRVASWALIEERVRPLIVCERADPRKQVQVWICELRKRLGADSIETIQMLGYRLTTAGLERVEQALAA